MSEASLKQKLESIGQGHVLRFADKLDPARRGKLTKQLEALDLDAIAELAESQVRTKAPLPLPKEIQPVKAYPRVPGPDHVQLYRDAEARGRELLKGGKIGAF